MEQSDSREKLFDSFLNTVNVSVNTEIPMDFISDSKEEDFDIFHLYEEINDFYEFHRMISVDDLTYSTLFSDEVFDNGEWHTYAGLETCNVKSTRHRMNMNNELLGKSIQSATEIGDSDIVNLACLFGDDTEGTGHTQVYDSNNNVLVGDSIGEDQIESDSDLEDIFFSDDEIYSDSDNGDYFSADESLEGVLDASFKSFPCTTGVVTQTLVVDELDPGTVLSSKVPNHSSEGKENDNLWFCLFDEMPLDVFDQDVCFSNPIDFVGSSIDIVDYVKDFLRRPSTLYYLLSAKSPDDWDDANSVWSILTSKLLHCQSDTSDCVRYFSKDSLKAIKAKQRFFDAANCNIPNGYTVLDKTEGAAIVNFKRIKCT